MRSLVVRRQSTRAVAVGLLVAAAAPVAGAQSPVMVRRDSVIVMRGGAGRIEGVRLDSLRTLVQSLQQAQFGSDEWFTLSRRIDSLVGAVQMRDMVQARVVQAPRGWIGFDAQGPRHIEMDETGEHLTYFAHPSIISVEPESPAGRAGITPGDVLLAYNGIDVVGHDFNLAELLVPERKIDVRVRRDGEPHDYTLTVAKAPHRYITMRLAPPMPPPRIGTMRSPILPGNIFIIARDGALGATMSTVGPELAQALKLSGTGLLVNQVAESSPAALAGVRAGDLVVSVDSRPVSTLEQLRAVVQANMDRHELPLRVVRERKTRDITVKW